MRSTSFAFSLGLAAVSPFVLQSCDSSSGAVAPTEAPSNLDYGSNFFGLTNCVDLAPIVPTLDGSTGTTFEVVPSLPEGLILNPFTGAISGQLDAVTGSNFVTVTASNALGSTDVGLTFDVQNPPPPSAITLPTSESALFVGGPVALGAPTVDGTDGVVYSFDVAPPLPPGLVLNTATGAISGTPSAPVGPAAYTVRAIDCAGQFTETNVVLGVGGGALNPATPNALAVANADGTVSLFKIDPTTGVMQPLGYAPIGGVPIDVSTSADQTQLFALLQSGELVSVPLDATGAGLLPSAFGPGAIPGLGSPGELVTGPGGTALYVSDPGSGQLHALGLDGLGRPSQLPGSPLALPGGGSPSEIDVAENGQFLFALEQGSQTLVATQLGTDGAFGGSTQLPTGPSPQDVTTVNLASGRTIVYVSNAGDSTISVFEATNGPSLSLLQTQLVPAGSFPEQIEVVRVGGRLFLFVSKSATSLITSLEINAGTGELSFAENVFGQAGVVDFSFANDGSAGFLGLGAENAVRPIDIERTSGELMPVFDAGRPQSCLRTHGTPVATTLVHSSAARLLRTRNVFTANSDSADISEFAFNGGLGFLGSTPVGDGGSPIDLATTIDGGSLYVVDEAGFTTDDLFQFRVDDAGLGEVRSIDLGASFGGSLSGAQSLAVDPSSRFSFVSRDGAPGVVHGFRADGFGGFEGSFTDGAANGPRGTLAEPAGRFLYVANRFGNLVSQHRIDATSGALSLVSTAATGSGPVAVASDLGGCLIYVLLADTGQVEALATNPTSGVLSLISRTDGAGNEPVALAVHRSGAFLVSADASSGELKRFAISDGTDGSLPGAAVLLGGTATSGIPSDVEFSADGGSLFVTLRDLDVVRQYLVDAASGSLTPVGDAPAGDSPRAVSVRNIVQ